MLNLDKSTEKLYKPMTEAEEVLLNAWLLFSKVIVETVELDASVSGVAGVAGNFAFNIWMVKPELVCALPCQEIDDTLPDWVGTK